VLGQRRTRNAQSGWRTASASRGPRAPNGVPIARRGVCRSGDRQGPFSPTVATPLRSLWPRQCRFRVFAAVATGSHSECRSPMGAVADAALASTIRAALSPSAPETPALRRAAAGTTLTRGRSSRPAFVSYRRRPRNARPPPMRWRRRSRRSAARPRTSEDRSQPTVAPMRTAKGGDRSVSASARAVPTKAPKSETAVPTDHSQIRGAYPAHRCAIGPLAEPPVPLRATCGGRVP
jgi:hypothetical protein